MLWLQSLRRWREYAVLVACAVEKVVPGALVFVAGGAVEDRLTISSDIDVVVVLPHRPSFEEAVDLRTRILEEAEKLGLPLTAPVEIHLVGQEDLKYYKTLERVKCESPSQHKRMQG